MIEQMETVTKVSLTPMSSESNPVMLVDDNSDITDVLKIGLESLGFSLDTYNDPLIALSEFKSKKYDAVILDVRMPRLNGFELYRKMKATDGIASYFFLTADIEIKEFEKIFPEIGTEMFIQKPISIYELAARLHRVLSRRKRNSADLLKTAILK